MRQDFFITRDHVNQIEGILPLLFKIQGPGQAEARDAAMELMAVLDAIDIRAPQPPGAEAAIDSAMNAIETLITSLDQPSGEALANIRMFRRPAC